MIAIDYFAGLGGFTQGAITAGAQVALSANHNPDAVEWHKRNHPETYHLQQDVGELDPRALPDFDLFLASPCCQGFSPSGRPGQSTQHRVNREKVLAKRQVARNTSFAVLNVADVRRPRRILVENVVEFLEWRGFPAWRAMLEAFGYNVETHQLLASDYGSPQERLRAIVTASLDQPIKLAQTWSGRPQRKIGDCLLKDDDPACRWVPLDSKSSSIQQRIARAKARAGDPHRFTWANVDSARARTEDQLFATLTTRSLSQLHLVDGDRVRRLEARELARAMSLPDSYLIPNTRKTADRLIGNMIDCSLSEGIVSQVLNA